MLNDVLGPELDGLRERIELRLEALCPVDRGGGSPLSAAVRYALLAPAKRLRPTLTLLSAAHFGGEQAQQDALDPGCAIELVHTASLILDDLPSMDDAAVRRGRPACHRRFGEDVAILAAVGLLNQGFSVIARTRGVSPAARLELVDRLSAAVGFDGLVSGQVMDLREKPGLDGEALLALNHQKTGVLFVAAVEAGALVAGAKGRRRAGAVDFAAHLGSAFQIMDDLIDATGTSESAGKDVGKDDGRRTFVARVGPEEARRQIGSRLDEALSALQAVEPSGPLTRFAEALFAPLRLAA